MFQVLAAKTPCIAVPLPTSARNHQWHNAEYFKRKGLCYTLEQSKSAIKQLPELVHTIENDVDLKKQLRTNVVKNEALKIATTITN